MFFYIQTNSLDDEVKVAITHLERVIDIHLTNTHIGYTVRQRHCGGLDYICPKNKYYIYESNTLT